MADYVAQDFIGARAAGDGWFGIGPIDPATADGFDDSVGRLRALQDQLASVTPTPAACARVNELLDAAIELLQPHTAQMGHQLVGRLLDRPGRGQALIPAYVIDDFDGVTLRGRVDFSAFYIGGNGAIHGGAIPLLFDELMGWTGAYQRPRMRTAYLHVDFRSPAMFGHELTFRVWVEREEGRKVFVRGTLEDGETRVADVEGLWVILRPGQT